MGASLIANMAEITEINPLSPHYICPKCKYSDFESDEVRAYAGMSGWDLPDKICPVCGKKLKKDGHDIPLETLLGINGDKEAIINLAFSGEIQQKVQKYTEMIFGKGHVFSAGSIDIIDDETEAKELVEKYAKERNIQMKNAEINRLAQGCLGIKRRMANNLGKIVAVPKDKSIYEFSPIQYTPDDTKTDMKTTHFDFRYIYDNLLQFDIVKSNELTILKHLKDLTGVDPLDVPMEDEETISFFNSDDIIELAAKRINSKTNIFGKISDSASEVCRMLAETKPSSFSELVRIYALLHSTGAWYNNQRKLVNEGVVKLKEVIATRDDIMVYLMNRVIDRKTAFIIRERARMGREIPHELENIMAAHNVPEWYMDSCKKIRYLLPKSYAVAHVANLFRITYFKLKYPQAFYEAVFSKNTTLFDYFEIFLLNEL